MAAADFFISYTQSDLDWASWVGWQLEAAGYRVILQAWDFKAGENFIGAMDRAATEAQQVVAILSPEYLDARYTHPEWMQAVARDPKGTERALIPVRIKEVRLEGLLRSYAYIDLVGLTEEVARRRLLSAIDDDRKKPVVEPQYPAPNGWPGARPLHLTIPKPPKVWLGREPEERRVLERLRDFKIVSIEGARGAGKTSLALRVVDTVLTRGHFGAAVWCSASGEPFSLIELLDRISLTFDFPHTLQLEPARKKQAILEELEHKGISCLVVLDDFGRTTDPELSEFVERHLSACCTILITSSSACPMTTDELVVVTINELPSTSARDLFNERAHQRGLGDIADDDRERLLDQTHGNPLAIEWVIGQLRLHQREPGTIVDDLRRGKAPVLDHLFKLAWDGLNEEARRVLCSLSLFADEATAAALRHVADVTDFPAAYATLRRLYLLKTVTRHAAHVDDRHEAAPVERAGYALHPLTREFARARLVGDLNDLLVDRLAGFYSTFVREHGGAPEGESRTDLQIVDRERANVLAALNASHEAGRLDAFLDELVAVSRWLFINGLWNRLEYWVQRGLPVARQAGNAIAVSRLLAEQGRVHSHRGELEIAVRTIEEAVEAVREGTTPNLLVARGYALHHLGEALSRASRFDEANVILARALECFEEARTDRHVIGVRYRIAHCTLRSGNIRLAKELYQRGLRDTQKAGWDRLEAYHRNELADIALLEGDLVEARLHLNEAARLAPVTDTRRLAAIERSMAKLETRAGNLEKARTWASAARDHYRKLGMYEESDDAARMVLVLQNDPS